MSRAVFSIRLVLTVVLLVVVWRHAHWSVALCLTLLAIFSELMTWLFIDIAQALKKMERNR